MCLLVRKQNVVIVARESRHWTSAQAFTGPYLLEAVGLQGKRNRESEISKIKVRTKKVNSESICSTSRRGWELGSSWAYSSQDKNQVLPPCTCHSIQFKGRQPGEPELSPSLSKMGTRKARIPIQLLQDQESLHLGDRARFFIPVPAPD